MIFDWYKLFNLNEWNATGLVSRTLTFELEGRGQVPIHITKGNSTNITVEDVFLPIQFADKNPWVSEGRAVYVDSNFDVHLGYEVEE